jgi:hypothetical protein
MLIDTRKAADIRRMLGEINSTTKFPEPADATLSLAAAIDLVLFSLSSGHRGPLTNWLSLLGIPLTNRIISSLETRRSVRSQFPFARLSSEVFPIRLFADVQGSEWVLFRARFAKSAAGGKKGNLFRGVSSVLAEMGDNVVWHAPASRDAPCRGVAAYHVTEQTVCFSVADDGRGFLQSLRTNPQWHHLKTEREALEAVLFRHATRRAGEATGGGFTVLYNKLLSVNGSVLIRSGTCTATLKSTVGGNHRVVFREGESAAGSQITVIVAKSGDPTEVPLEKHS